MMGRHMPAEYLSGLQYTPAESPGIYQTAHHHQAGAYRIIGSYADLQRFKESMAGALTAFRNERGDWQIHHIVEGRHFADLDFEGRLADLYTFELPCVLIHQRTEHELFSRIQSTKATDELYREWALSGDSAERSRQAKQAAADRRTHAQLRRQIEDYKRLYSALYSNDHVLRRIALNVFNKALGTLSAAGAPR